LVEKEKMKIKYYIQKLLGRWLDQPIIPEGKTTGYSLVRSEKFNSKLGKCTKVIAPFFLHYTQLGDYSYIAKNSNINYCTIGKFCSIGPNFSCGLGIHPTWGLSTAPMFYSTAKQNGMTLCKKNKTEESRRSVIGNDVFIGANVTVLDGVHIADGAVIGAGAVVVDDIPPYAVAVGVPAKVVKYRFEHQIIEKLLEKQWWNGSDEELKLVERDFSDVEKYLFTK
jgi:acetyltransferase-like isoleucine patch superfamily enzyme